MHIVFKSFWRALLSGNIDLTSDHFKVTLLGENYKPSINDENFVLDRELYNFDISYDGVFNTRTPGYPYGGLPISLSAEIDRYGRVCVRTNEVTFDDFKNTIRYALVYRENDGLAVCVSDLGKKVVDGKLSLNWGNDGIFSLKMASEDVEISEEDIDEVLVGEDTTVELPEIPEVGENSKDESLSDKYIDYRVYRENDVIDKSSSLILHLVEDGNKLYDYLMESYRNDSSFDVKNADKSLKGYHTILDETLVVLDVSLCGYDNVKGIYTFAINIPTYSIGYTLSFHSKVGDVFLSDPTLPSVYYGIQDLDDEISDEVLDF